jgi:hypothetical protein
MKHEHYGNFGVANTAAEACSLPGALGTDAEDFCLNVNHLHASKATQTKDNEERLRNALTIEQKQGMELRSETWSVVFKEANLLIDDLRALDSPRVGQEKAK